MTTRIDVAAAHAEPSRQDLERALGAADLRVLLMCLYQASGDERWLSDPYSPRRDVQMVADPAAGLPEPIQEEIREAAAEVFASPVEPAIEAPTGNLLLRMMSHCLGEDVPPEYEPMIAQDLGFAPRSGSAETAVPTDALDVVIIGAGASGISLGVQLSRAGIPFTVVEKNPDAGGTWFENIYPGCGVDTPNHFYSFSFAPNPNWTRHFSLRNEVQSYLLDVSEEYGIREQTRFGTEVVGAVWDADAERWTVCLRDRQDRESSLTCSVLVSAAGHFNAPHEPTFGNEAAFDGRIVHTAKWPRDLDVTGKRVTVIGTGASAVQLVPTIVDEVSALTVVQRTPQWVRPVRGYQDQVERESMVLFAQVPFYAQWYRFTQLWRFGDGLLRFLKRDPDWPHPGRSLNRGNERHRQEMENFIGDELDGRPDLLERCVPDYPPFAKRILIDCGWYASLRQPHVRLVSDGVDGFELDGIRTASGEVIPTDIVVLATGFRVTELAARIDLRGRSGIALKEDWADDNPTAYLGMTVPNFPNFFVMFGPNTNMGHGGSGMWLAETQSDYIVDAIRQMNRQGISSMCPSEAARTSYMKQVDELHDDLVWTHPGVSTYYRNESGQVRSPMPFRLVDYWQMTRTVDLEQFELSFRATNCGERLTLLGAVIFYL